MDQIAEISANYSEYLGRLPGVINSSVVFNGNEIREVHILSDISRSPKQIVRDVQSLFMAQFQKEIDHKIVSVAQVEFDITSQSATRLSFEEFSISRKKTCTEIEIVLTQQESRFTGSRICSNDKLEICRAISQCTLDSVAQSLENSVSLTVLDVKFVDLADSLAVLVCVSLKTDGGILNRFTGSAFVSEDNETAVVKATLNAVNRKLCHS